MFKAPIQVKMQWRDNLAGQWYQCHDLQSSKHFISGQLKFCIPIFTDSPTQLCPEVVGPTHLETIYSQMGIEQQEAIF